VYVVDLYHAITTADLGPDGVHPSASGYDKLGHAWHSAINAALLNGAPGTNVALNKPIAASSSSLNAAFAVDGNTTTRWAANGNVRPSSLTVDLGASFAVNRTETQFEFGDGEFYQYRVEYSADNVNWATFAGNTGNRSPRSIYVDYGSVNARYFRITMTGAQNGGDWPSIWEFQVYGSAGGSSQSPVLSGHTYHIINANSGQFLDNPNGTNVHGTFLQQFPDTNSTAQQWTAMNVGGNKWTFANVAGGLAIDNFGWSNTPGSRIDEWDNWGGVVQQWQILPVGDGTFRLRSSYSGLNMEVQGASLANAAPVGQWFDNGASCQHWRFQ